MKKLDFTAEVKFGDKIIDDIIVNPCSFVELAQVWGRASRSRTPEISLQRERIKFQTHFMSGGARVMPDDSNLSLLPIVVAREIIKNLDAEIGERGVVLVEGDGASKPILFKLGTPVEAKSGKGATVKISELEFMAHTFGDVEEVLAAPQEMDQAVALLRKVAKPVGDGLTLMALPGWALDRITVADGLEIMKNVLPSF